MFRNTYTNVAEGKFDMPIHQNYDYTLHQIKEINFID